MIILLHRLHQTKKQFLTEDRALLIILYLDDKDIESTMTESENCEYHLMLKDNNDHGTSSCYKSRSKAIQQSSSTLTELSISELSDNKINSSQSMKKTEMNVDP